MPNGKTPVDPRVPTVIAMVVTGIWALSFIVNIVNADYNPPPSIHAAFMLIVGAIFGYQLIKGGTKSNGGE